MIESSPGIISRILIFGILRDLKIWQVLQVQLAVSRIFCRSSALGSFLLPNLIECNRDVILIFPNIHRQRYIYQTSHKSREDIPRWKLCHVLHTKYTWRVGKLPRWSNITELFFCFCFCFEFNSPSASASFLSRTFILILLFLYGQLLFFHSRLSTDKLVHIERLLMILSVPPCLAFRLHFRNSSPN